LTFVRLGSIFSAQGLQGGLTMFRCRSVVLLFVLSVAAALAACSSPSLQSGQPADTRASDAAAIRAADAEWGQAMQAKDVDKSVSFYADDAILLGDKGPAMRGRENIRNEFQKMLSHPSGTVAFTNTGVEVARSGDIAWDYGTYKYTGLDKSGKPMTETGKYLTVWKKQSDGTWKAFADMDNTDQ
jgi:uncharacterized protein (TIGR02246 family)